MSRRVCFKHADVVCVMQIAEFECKRVRLPRKNKPQFLCICPTFQAASCIAKPGPVESWPLEGKWYEPEGMFQACRYSLRDSNCRICAQTVTFSTQKQATILFVLHNPPSS